MYYGSHGTTEGDQLPTQLPMLVVEGFRDSSVSGWVMYTDGMKFKRRVPYAHGMKPGTWTRVLEVGLADDARLESEGA